MLMKSLALATAIVIGTFCTANATGRTITEVVKAEFNNCTAGTPCSVRVQLPANKLIRIKGISCVNLSANVTSVDVKIGKNAIWDLEFLLLERDMNKWGSVYGDNIWIYENYVIATKAKELWLTINSTAEGQALATCYTAF